MEGGCFVYVSLWPVHTGVLGGAMLSQSGDAMWAHCARRVNGNKMSDCVAGANRGCCNEHRARRPATPRLFKGKWREGTRRAYSGRGAAREGLTSPGARAREQQPPEC